MIKLLMEFFGKHRYVDSIGSYLQLSDTSCGPASLHMVYRALGKTVFEEAIIDQFETNYKGLAYWKDLTAHPESVGLASFVFYNCNFRLLRTIYDRYGFPTIVLWSRDNNVTGPAHFSPIKRVTRDGIVIADPYSAHMEFLNKKSFERKWIKDTILVVGPANSSLKL